MAASIYDKLRAMSWQDHLAYMGQMHDRQAAAFKSIQAAATTLLAALDDTQKSHALPASSENFGPGMMAWRGGFADDGTWFWNDVGGLRQRYPMTQPT